MLLVIDSGNTNCVFAIHDGKTWRGEWRASADSRRTADEYAVWLTQLMALRGLTPEDVTASIMANVVPASDYSLQRLCRDYFGGVPMTVGRAGVHLGVPVHMDRPEQVGADRLVNALAAYERYGGPTGVVDFGTATTFDVVGEDGGYEGGVIAPGIHSSMEALYMAAAKLPRIAVEKPSRVIGKATVPAMQSGVFWGYIGLIEGIIARIEGEYGKALTVVATGGLAPLFEAETDSIHHVDPDLTLRGLLRIYEANTKHAGEGE